MTAPPLEVVRAGPDDTPGRPPVLLVHGVRHAAWCWEAWQHRLAELGWRSAAVSLRGHGRSGGTTRGATLAAYVDDVLTAGRQLGAAPVLVGHSMGGLLVQRAVHQMPSAGLAMLAPAPAHSGLPFAVRFARRHPRPFLQVVAGRPLPFAAHDLLSDQVSSATAEATMQHIGPESAIVQYQFTLPRRAPEPGPGPTLLLATPDDRIIPVPDVERTARRHGVPVHWFDGLGHDLMLEPSPEPFTALQRWLETAVEG